tara:strand:- start:682 stop:2043 length:1362 start_codon:yes stop_codon:yes gene_type:complete
MTEAIELLEKSKPIIPKHKVLIVEDMRVVADYLEELLVSFGYDVIGKCVKGEDVLSLYEIHLPDIMFVDIVLEGAMTGIDAVEQVKGIGNPMVIYITSTPIEQDFDRVKNTMPNGFLRKPFDAEQLKATTEIALHTYFERNKQREILEKKNSMQNMNIQELSETNAHLVAATWRERDLKRQLKESLEQLEINKAIIEQQNKRIVDSINYANRIQQAIIPTSIDISKVVENHFMIYRPKDVVSGDFPWMFEKGDYVYFGAVDCTGHGVPGAMLSMIGYLLLNGIVNVDGEGKKPSEVLTELHHEIVKTLKQNVEGNNASDGMDIALCRINRKKNEVLYSGAHRPLYHLADGAVNEHKGDRFPIGGVQYKSEYIFTDKKVTVNDGESIYFFSDGFPDQFGGDKNRKFGSKRIRNLIQENENKSMVDMKDVFENQLDRWMETEKQLDDILMIGVKF